MKLFKSHSSVLENIRHPAQLSVLCPPWAVGSHSALPGAAHCPLPTTPTPPPQLHQPSSLNTGQASHPGQTIRGLANILKPRARAGVGVGNELDQVSLKDVNYEM